MSSSLWRRIVLRKVRVPSLEPGTPDRVVEVHLPFPGSVTDVDRDMDRKAEWSVEEYKPISSELKIEGTFTGVRVSPKGGGGVGVLGHRGSCM